MVAYYADDGLLKPPLHVIRYDRKTGGIPDLINAELARSMEQLNEQAWRESQKKDSWWDRLAHFAGRLIESPGLTKLIGDLGIHCDDIRRVATMLKNPLIKTQEEREAKIAEMAAVASSQKDAATIVQNYFDHVRQSYELKYPSSLLKYPSTDTARAG